MKNLIEKAGNSFYKQTNPDTSSYECFFHYTDIGIYESGFIEGYKLALDDFWEWYAKLSIEELEWYSGKEIETYLTTL